MGIKDTLKGNKPRWLILLVDLFLVWGSFFISYFLVFKQRGVMDWEPVELQFALITGVYLLFFLLFQPYRSVVHRTGLRDLQRIALTVSSAFLLLAICARLQEWRPELFSFLGMFASFSHTQLLLHAFMTGFAMGVVRIGYRSVYHNLFWHKENVVPVILFGAGNMGNTTFYFLRASTRNKYKIVAILDDNPTRIGKLVQGHKVQHLNCLNAEFLEKHDMPQELIIAIDDHFPERLQRIFKQAEPLPLKVEIIPNSARLLAGDVATRQIRA